MKLYIYAKSSHRDGLENVRRSSALCKMLQKCNPTLCTGDYRAASIAKDTMGVKNTMGIDAMGNLPHTMERLDMLIYDNEDVTPEMHAQMDEFCTRLYEVGKDIPLDLVDSEYFLKYENVLDKAVFFSDEDYRKWFVDFCKGSKKYDIPLLNGNYFFLDVEEQFLKSFSEVIEEEEYFDTISKSKYLLCGSVHTCLESLAAGNKPVFFKRRDKEPQSLELLEKYKIPTATGENLDALMENFEHIIKNYPHTQEIKMYDASCVEDAILASFKEFAHISPAIDYSYEYAN